MAVDQEYVDALVVYAKESASNLAWLQKRRCDLAAALVTYGGGQLLSVAAPGQHIAFGRPDGTTIQDEFTAVNFALKQISGIPAVIEHVHPLYF